MPLRQGNYAAGSPKNRFPGHNTIIATKDDSGSTRGRCRHVLAAEFIYRMDTSVCLGTILMSRGSLQTFANYLSLYISANSE
jgi:hypothetical protein